MSSRRAHKTEKELLEEGLDALELPEIQRNQLKARYIDYIDFLERNATGSRRGHYATRLTAGIGSVIVTSLSGAKVLGNPPSVFSWILLVTSIAVGIALAVDGFLNLGERWRHYRAAVEGLKGQGWRFIQRTAPYAGLSDTDAAQKFAEHVEDLIRDEIGEYVQGPALPGPPST